MPVFEQGYRNYVGERTRGGRVAMIAWENIRPRMRWWVWLLLLLLDAWPYAIYAVLIFVATLGATMFGGNPVSAVATPKVAFEGLRGFGPGMVLGFLNGDMLGLVWQVLDGASYASLIFPAVVASGLLASDRRTGALQIYFARPVTRLQYLLGKMLAATALVALTTAVPCLLLWLEAVAFGSASTYSWRTWVAPFAILGASAFYALWSVALGMSLSAIVRRPAFAATAVLTIHLVLDAVGAILAKAYRDPAWKVIRPSYAIGTLTAPLCGMDLPPWISPAAAFGIAFVLPLSLLGIVWWRLRAVEVAT